MVAYRVFVYALFSVQGVCRLHISLQTPCNFSKEQYVLPEDGLRIETCRSILSVLM
jgi:hypothetical protein